MFPIRDLIHPPMIPLLVSDHCNDSAKSRFRFAVTVKQHRIVGSSLNWDVTAPRLAVVDRPECYPAELLTVLVKQREQFSVSTCQILLHRVRQGIRVGI